MLLPSKVTPYSASLFAPMVTIAETLRKHPQTVRNLLTAQAIKRIEVDVVFQCLDAMFALGRVELNSETGELAYVG